MRKTSYRLYWPGGLTHDHWIYWPKDPGYSRIRDLLELIFGKGASFEHVTVWLGEGMTDHVTGKGYADMFVDERGVLKELDRNNEATRLYRANYLTHVDPEADPESLPFIAGVAVVFFRQIWF